MEESPTIIIIIYEDDERIFFFFSFMTLTPQKFLVISAYLGDRHLTATSTFKESPSEVLIEFLRHLRCRRRSKSGSSPVDDNHRETYDAIFHQDPDVQKMILLKLTFKSFVIFSSESPTAANCCSV